MRRFKTFTSELVEGEINRRNKMNKMFTHKMRRQQLFSFSGDVFRMFFLLFFAPFFAGEKREDKGA